MAVVREWDNIFASIHGETMSWEERILDDLRDAVEEHSPQFPPPIIERYAKFRIFTRYVIGVIKVFDVLMLNCHHS